MKEWSYFQLWTKDVLAARVNPVAFLLARPKDILRSLEDCARCVTSVAWWHSGVIDLYLKFNVVMYSYTQPGLEGI